MVTEAELAKQTHDLIGKKKYKEAEQLVVPFLINYPDSVWALVGLGISYRAQKKYDAAEACYRRALLIAPNNAEIHSNLSNLMKDADRMGESLKHGEKAVEIEPDHYTFINNLAVNYREAMESEKSLQMYKECEKHRPDDPVTKSDIGFVSMYLNDLDTAWDYFEWRLKTDQVPFPDTMPIPKWEGETDTQDKKLLIISEQGFGDSILMSRFLPLMAEKFKDVYVSCKPPLAPLFEHLPVKLVNHEKISLRGYDYYTPMMSIPRHVEKDWHKWPAMPKLSVTAQSQQKYAFLDNYFIPKKVGIVWSGSVTFKNNEKRSASLEYFMALAAKHPNIQFFSFQKGEREEDLKTFGAGTVLPLGHSFQTFSDTAAALQHMDMIIMTDSALAHLAGAFDVPVLNLLNYRPYWLYTPKSHTTTLYNTMRFIHQPAPNDWDAVFGIADEVLTAYAQSSDADILGLIDDILKKQKL